MHTIMARIEKMHDKGKFNILLLHTHTHTHTHTHYQIYFIFKLKNYKYQSGIVIVLKVGVTRSVELRKLVWGIFEHQSVCANELSKSFRFGRWVIDRDFCSVLICWHCSKNVVDCRTGALYSCGVCD